MKTYYPNKKYEDQEFINYISKYEWEIILKLLSYPYMLLQASKYREPHRITNYLEDLSASFHSFWNMGKDNESLRMIHESNLNKNTQKIIGSQKRTLFNWGTKFVSEYGDSLVRFENFKESWLISNSNYNDFLN